MFLLNRATFLILTAFMYGQLPTPLRYSLKSFDLDSTYNKGMKSNIVAEIRSVGDSLTWFGTGQGLALHNNTTNKLYSHKTISGNDTLANKQLKKPQLLPHF